MSMIYRTSIHWRNAFLNSAAASTAAASTSVSFTSGSTGAIGSSCSNSRMMAMSIIRRTVSTSNSSGGEQAQATPNLTPDKSHNVLTRKKSEYMLGKHRSNALELLQKQPVIEVDGDMAVCDGGGGALGHPLEYIKLGARADYGQDGNGNEEDGVACIYCGLRYRSKKGSHHH